MDKYERRRRRLIQLRDEFCKGKNVTLAEKIGSDASYVSRMLYEEGKPGKKRIADDMLERIESAFDLPRGWMDELVDADGNAIAAPHPAPALTDAQQMILAACEGFSPRQIVALTQAAVWIAEGRELKPGDPPQKKLAAAARNSA